MNRYFLYLILMNMLINVIMFVPKILIEYRFDGAVMGIIIAIPISLTLTFLWMKAFSHFPQKGLPEILKSSKHRWFILLFYWLFVVFWFSAGLVTLIEFCDILIRFINPEFPKLMIVGLYLASICFIFQFPTEKVMYLLEIVLFINTPVIVFVIFKAITSDNISWDAIFEVGTHLFKMPNLIVIGTATYVFSGFANLLIFNRVMKKKLSNWNIAIVFILGTFNLFSTFFIPIGFHGADFTEQYLYPWISTSDSMRMVYSPIERVLFIFLIFYMSMVLVSVSVHWHVAFEFSKDIFYKKWNKKKHWGIVASFVAVCLICTIYSNTVLLNKLTTYWMIVRFIFEIFLVTMFFFWARRRSTL